MKNSSSLRVLAAVSLAACNFGVSAQDFMSQRFIKQGDETFTLNLGGIVNQFGTSLQLNSAGANGSSINLENVGLPKTTSSVYVGGTWRFWSRNRIDILYFGAKRSGDRTVDREITVNGTVIPANSVLTTEAKSQFVLANYRYSFVKTDELELAALLGVYGGEFSYQLSATQALQGGGQSSILNTSTSTTVPLPLIGVSLDWYITPRWRVAANAEGIKARIGDIDGSAFVGGINTEYMLVRNLGLGLAYMYSDLDVDVTKNGFNGTLGWKMSSVGAYAHFKF
jgi:hypothetical protein